MTTATGRAEWISRLTVRTWLQLVLGLMVLVVVTGSAITAIVLSDTTRVWNRLVNEIQPAATESYRLQGALFNEETGVRGYALTADPQFLAPFDEGVREQERASGQLRQLLRDRPALLADLDALEQSARTWRQSYADPLIASVTPGVPQPIDPAFTAGGKVAFDELRGRFATQTAALDAAVAKGRADLDRQRALRNSALLGTVLAFLLTAAALAVLLRRLVWRPLRELETASRLVADGDFGHRISVRGPADLAVVAEAVESMRRRIVAELDDSRVKEAILAEQTVDLDSQAVELRRSNAELEQFAYVASHDLQEPLRKVASFCQLLEKRYGEQLDDRAKQYIEFAVDGAKRMQVLINDLLTFSRVGRVNDHIVTVGLDRALDRALADLSEAAADSGLTVQRPEQLPELAGDSNLLIMLWQNLIANAIKFHRPEVAPQIRIECEAEPGDPAGWRFTVTDNGIGIAPEFADKVFVIFQRLHSRDEYTGTGIGLALVKKIVEFHGGRVWIDTAYAEGARFHFTLFDVEPRPGHSALPDKEPVA
ncbi:CHASE3 domain-containing protein [Nocardia sp. 2]|uniref:histidine kinase n=1 Tax=Nocardia acididurans TaxID=2802282 RepID=A0ABS1M9H9_9NOCA|nr:CHASE3 domain-containing protein [Nocardia acididurans]MBL1076404.1 CHASE3 domain-containing protein [Nocardia acididurans]